MLREAGLKATPTRIALLEFLSKSSKPLAVPRIVKALRNRLDHATVYRNLRALERERLVRRVDFRHDHAHFELGDPKDHHHFICLRCGETEDFTGCNVAQVTRRALGKSKKFETVSEHSLEIFGTCKKCA